MNLPLLLPNVMFVLRPRILVLVQMLLKIFLNSIWYLRSVHFWMGFDCLNPFVLNGSYLSLCFSQLSASHQLFLPLRFIPASCPSLFWSIWSSISQKLCLTMHYSSLLCLQYFLLSLVFKPRKSPKLSSEFLLLPDEFQEVCNPGVWQDTWQDDPVLHQFFLCNTERASSRSVIKMFKAQVPHRTRLSLDYSWRIIC